MVLLDVALMFRGRFLIIVYLEQKDYEINHMSECVLSFIASTSFLSFAFASMLNFTLWMQFWMSSKAIIKRDIQVLRNYKRKYFLILAVSLTVVFFLIVTPIGISCFPNVELNDDAYNSVFNIVFFTLMGIGFIILGVLILRALYEADEDTYRDN